MALDILATIYSGLIGRMHGGWLHPKWPRLLRDILKITHGYVFVFVFWEWINFSTDVITILPLALVGPLFWLGEKPGVGHPYGFLAGGYEKKFEYKEYTAISNNKSFPETYETLLFVKDKLWTSIFVRGLIYGIAVPVLINGIQLGYGLYENISDLMQGGVSSECLQHIDFFWWLLPLAYGISNFLNFFLQSKIGHLPKVDVLGLGLASPWSWSEFNRNAFSVLMLLIIVNY